MGAGRPPKFENVAQMQILIDAYFAERETKELPLTVTGLALALDTTRDLLCDYENKPEYSDTIKRAKAKVADYAEQMLYMGKGAAGPIFALKNFGWSDKQEVEHSGGVSMQIVSAIEASPPHSKD
jgi:hypothetical protein